MTGTWEFWIDRGGTFTDVIGRDPDRRLHVLKLLSERPEHYADAAVHGIRTLLGLADDAPLPSERIAAVKMGTTVATNALLEREGAPTLLAITAGHADALRIATQHRPRLFDRHIVLPSMLHAAVAEIHERVDAEGHVLAPLDPEQVRRALAPARAAGIEAIAIVLMHGWRFTAHEQRVATIARELGFTQISVSHRVSPLRKLIGRGDTTVVDAYLSPILRHYVDRLVDALGEVDLQFMQSNGGLIDAGHFQGKDAILSGPAGGIVGAVVTSGQAGFDRIIGFDMGGTSTDVAHYAGSFERSFETMIAGVRLRAPMLEVHTVAAGGGSICRFEQGRYRVGPESAGADPGPACYRRGGPLTVTDCNVMLGKLHPELFPALFGASGRERIDVEIVARRFAELADRIAAATGDRRSPAEVAEGFIEIAVANMAEAIAKISIERGHDLDDHALCCFGGAAGQHACLVADALGMRTVVIHPLAGVLSAYGMGLAELRVLRERSLGVALDEGQLAHAREWLATLAREARAELAAQSHDPARAELIERVHLRYAGSDRSLALDWIADVDALHERFSIAHLDRYGFELPREPVVIELVLVEARIPGERPEQTGLPTASAIVGEPREPTPLLHTQARMAASEWTTPVYRREDLPIGATIEGPAILADANATTVVEPQWNAIVRASGHLVLERRVARPDRVLGDLGAELERPDPVRLELFNNLFGAIAEQMGVALCNTAHSVNIKERLDFSCAVFDREGHLIANAPHMPVHLGSMGASVRAVIEGRGGSDRTSPVRAGDAFLVNAPYHGGTHLPDLTVISPVFLGGGDSPDFWVASRGHHADIGGITPGSMPADSTHVDQEGVLFDDFLLVEQGHLRRLHLRERLLAGRWPARDPDQNLADLEAQLAANHRGAQELARMVEHWSLPRVHAYMGHVRRNAAAAVSEAIRELARRSGESGPRRFAYAMDEGSEVVVAITLDGERGRCKVDFTGTSAQRPNNFNAPRAVCQAAVLYVFRTLVDADIPLNEGCMDPIELVIPPGSMLDPRHPAAVVAGNVETSQVICDALYGALGVMAAAQGTMNNVTFGDSNRQYYETVCGGSGAGPGFDGCDAVHTHMTNSRLTDPEVLEERYPVVLERFEIRRGSGGAGQWRGGDGVRRVLRFLAPMELVVLANRRVIAPFGMQGGEPGALGRNWVDRADGSRCEIGSRGALRVDRGDVFVLETPGGGGWGHRDRP
ncbi:hydantoinase B/oxoprolinase family protein [Nannocystaceae bacterium ST9]